jgi:hypothetical protein
MYRKHGLARVGKSPRQKLINKLDIAFAKMIKERDRNESCITCPNIQKELDDPRAWHCGHFRPRGSMGTRFDPRNAAKQCAYDNIYLEGRSYEFSLAIDKKYGKGTAAELYRLSKRITQIDERQLEQLLAAAKMGYRVYRQLYDELMIIHAPAVRAI